MKHKKQPSHVIVVSMMCALVVAVVAQSLDLQNMGSLSSPTDNAYASNESHPLGYHGAADTRTSQGDVKQQLDNLVNDQKKKIDDYIYGLLGGGHGSDMPTHSDTHPHTAHIPAKKDEELEKEKIENIGTSSTQPESGYAPFPLLQTELLDQNCDYLLPIDNTDPKISPIMQRALEHCLIKVSQSSKVYPSDILTHEMMRTIADRAGFVVKMEYSSSKPVTRAELFGFIDALQQHHNIGNIPVVVVQNPVTRGDYLNLMKKIFEQQSLSDLNNSKEIHFVSTESQETSDTKTIEELVVPETQTGVVSFDGGLDKELLKSTVAWLIDKI